MTLAASPSKAPPRNAAPPVRAAALQHFFQLWQVPLLVVVALIGFLAFTPDGVAEPLQGLASWLVVAGVTALAVLAVVTGLTRLLDCEGN